VSGRNIRFLVEKKLRPMGVLAAADGSSPKLERPDPLLALKFRTAVVPERLTNALTSVFRPLFWPPVVVVAILGFLALDLWLFLNHGIAPGLRHALYQPGVLLLVFGGVVLATAFHEIGHATACRYGGAQPGVMGVGLYLVWPAFYTDVTDAYRLGRGGRLRTDLGGIYFNAIFALGAAALYALTGFEPLLLLVLIESFAILQQLLPFVRLDGYYILSDLTGVPDLFARIKPVLRSLKPGGDTDPRVHELKPWVRAAVTAYVLVVVPLLLFSLLMALLHVPRVAATAYDSFGVQWDELGSALDRSAVVSAAARVIELLMLVLPVCGLALTLGRVGSRVGRGAWGWSAGGAERRAAVVALSGAAVALAVFTWWPNGDYRPIQPRERGTVEGGLASVADVPSGRPSLTPQRAHELGGAPSARQLHDELRLDQQPSDAPRVRPGLSGEARRRPKARGLATPSATPRARATPTATPTAAATATATPTPAATATATPAVTSTSAPASP
jgi:putative peptide zinc metalloprotease protein